MNSGLRYRKNQYLNPERMAGIKIYADLKIIPKSIYPNFFEFNKNFEFVTNIDQCDFVLFPHWEAVYEYSNDQYIRKGLIPGNKYIIQDAVERLIIQSKFHNKKSIIFYLSDFEKQITIENSLIFKTSIYASTRKENEFALPSAKEDFTYWYSNGILSIRKKRKKPTVGFRGSARPYLPNAIDIIRSGINLTNFFLDFTKMSFAKKYEWNRGQIVRKLCMDRLRVNPHITTDFSILIRGYINQPNQHIKELNHRKFIENMFNSDYILCARGAGNYSFRFYETLSAGRIPIFINTDCVLPLDDIIDWKKHCVWVDEQDINKIDQILLDFHHGLTNDDFVELQYNIRNLWLEWIRPEAYLGKFHQHIENIRSKPPIIPSSGSY